MLEPFRIKTRNEWFYFADDLELINTIKDVISYTDILIHDGKRLDCGTFRDEIEAAKSYNKKAAELNALETTTVKYVLNEID